MRRRAAFAALVVLVALPLRADFNSLVRAVETIPGLHRVWMPGFGLIRAAVWMVHPAGVHDFQIATFEGKHSGDIDPRELEQLIRRHADAGFQPMVQAHSRRTGELTLIWARPGNDNTVELLLLAHDPNDQTVVLRTVVDVDKFAREIANPHTATRVAAR
jgi:hypothetical protein